MIYTCIADGIRSPPAFFLKNKYKEPMKMQNENTKRVWLYAQPSSLRGGPGNPSVGINLDCSSFVQYCYWAQNLPFSAGSTAAYRNAADLVSISPSEVQPGDLRVVYASGGEQGHVQMVLGGGAWIECCYGYGVAVNMSNAWMESRPCYYFRYAGF